VVFAFALGTGLLMGFVVFRVQSLVDQNTDPYFFGDMGKSIADGNGFEGFGSLITRRAPLYPIVIGGVYAVFGDHQKLIVLLHVLMFSGTCVLAYDMGRRLFNHRTGVIAGFVCAAPDVMRYIRTHSDS
jgi:4-amino-4-deoxy-L-arabinose transferase-like glycosyltransferase